MTKDELTETITKAIRELGFARIPMPAIVNVFAPAGQASPAIQDELQDFAGSHGWALYEGGDFVVFYPPGAEPPGGVT